MSLIDFTLTQECTITPWVRYANGDDVFGESETRKCRMQAGKYLNATNVYIHPDGVVDTDEARAKMYCTGSPIPSRSIVMCEGQEFTVINCYQARGFTGSHLEVTLK